MSAGSAKLGDKVVRARATKPATQGAASAASRTEASMAEQLARLSPSSRRYQTLKAAIAFKRSWVKLAEHLSEVRRSGEFKEWGYRSLEAYAAQELHIKRDTVKKLTRSYEFLSEHESPMLQRALRSLEEGLPAPGAAPVDADASEAEAEAPAVEPMPPLPNFQALDILAEARNNPNLDEEDYREVREKVFSEDPTPGMVRKLVRERAPEPKKTPTPADRTASLRKVQAKLQDALGMLMEEQVPEGITRPLEEALGGLRQYLEE